jgi:hypothetical protein
MGSELEEILRRHGLEDLDLLDEHALDRVNALQQVASRVDVTGEHRFPDRLELEQDLLEPQLEDLVDLDEKELVMRGRVGLEALLV